MPAPTYFKVTHKDGSSGVPLSELLKMKQWKRILDEARQGTVYIDFHADDNVDTLYFSKDFDYSSRNELKANLNSYKHNVILRYGISKIDGRVILHLDLVKRN